MIMAKKKSRDKYTSKGVVGKTMKSRSNSDDDYASRRLMNQQAAWQNGKNVVVTIQNPNKNETNKPFIKVNARDIWGSPKRKYSIG